ncbi:beta strand repeat-containing protein, partial [Edwardsiella hoshinae]
MTNSNLTGRHVSLQGATNGPLMVTDSALHATDGDVTLNTTGGSLTVNNSNLSTTKGDITLNASKGVLAANNSNLHASGGDITIAGARVQKPGPDGVGITGGTLNATGNISITGYGTGGFSNGGLRLTNVVLNASAITLNGSKNTAPGNTGSTPGLDLNNATLTAVNDITLIGAANQNGMRIGNSSVLNSTQGHVSITGLSTGLGGYDKVSIDINNSTISAYSGITLSGNSTNNPGAGVVLDKANMTASAGNISVTGKGGGSANGSLYVKNSNFSAQNTVLEGTTSSGNNSVQLGGNITVTQGNLSVTGDGGNGGSVGIQGQSGLNVTVANGSLSMNGSTSGNSAGLNLTNASLSANNASLTGSNTGSGFGFVLNNVTLNGGIANGTNTTLSSAGSAGVVTNVIGQGVLNATTTEALMRAGIENNTQINASDVADLAESSSDDWTGDYTSSKGGGWIFDSANITKTGNINLTGVGFVNSNLTAGNISLSAATGSLLVTDSTLNATVGNVSLSTANGTLTVGNANLSSAGGETTLCATTSSGNGGAGVKLAGTVNATQGNLTVNGTNLAGEGNVWGVDARNATLNLSAENAVLTIMGNVANGVGLDLSG